MSLTCPNVNEFMRWAAKWQLQIAEHKCFVLSEMLLSLRIMHTVHLPNVNDCQDLCVFVDSQVQRPKLKKGSI